MIVVTGATGNVGRSLVQVLAAAGEKVTAVSRGASQVPQGVSHRQADLGEPESLNPVLDGADTLFLLVAGEDPQGIVEAARAGGVGRVVLLSSQGAGTRPEVYRHPLAFEDAVQRSGLEWTILRPGGFASNAFAWAETVRSRRTAAAPFGDVGLPFIDPADIAEVAAAVLCDGGHAGRTYELTGPASVTPRQRVQAIGEALGAPVRFVEQSREEARAQMLQFMPEPVVEGTLAILGEPMPAEQRVSPHVEQILGRPPRTFAEWAARNVAAFR
ncbi:NAD(P)H-binding protein [Streptosporangium canum]|uniref:NAD(P)H-binding protein n=1 Tax=Streptosporangium canum TaxID=324952 RepID=UPI0036953632